jgi:hypothetical protein
MKLINELTTSLNGFLRWDKRRMDCFTKILVALMVVQTVNLKKLACAMFGRAQPDSSYRRLQRFFSQFRINYNHFAKLMVSLFRLNQGKHYLILDRTNWQWGKRDINILFLCVAYKKIAIPIFWVVLNKKGNSSTRERIALIQRFVSVFGKDHIAGVLGDREFIGKAWFRYLKDLRLTFYFRIKKDADTVNSGGKSISVHWLFYGLPLQQPKLIEKARPIYGHKLHITGMRIDDDYLIVVTNKKPEASQPDEAIKIYAVRWEIETLFGCLKSKGFNFEDTHMTNRERIKKLIAILAIAFCWAHLTGEWRHQHEKTIPLKKHGRPQTSLFRYGLDWIMTALIKRGQKIRQLKRVFDEIFIRPLFSGLLGTNQ